MVSFDVWEDVFMFMWASIIMFIFIIFAGVIYIAFHNEAVNGESRLAMLIHFIAGLCIFIGIVLMFVFLIAAVKYD